MSTTYEIRHLDAGPADLMELGHLIDLECSFNLTCIMGPLLVEHAACWRARGVQSPHDVGATFEAVCRIASELNVDPPDLSEPPAIPLAWGVWATFPLPPGRLDAAFPVLHASPPEPVRFRRRLVAWCGAFSLRTTVHIEYLNALPLHRGPALELLLTAASCAAGIGTRVVTIDSETALLYGDYLARAGYVGVTRELLGHPNGCCIGGARVRIAE